VTLTNQNITDLVFVFTGTLLVFRKVAQMERHHTLRVFLLTAILSIGVICFFLMYGFTLGNPPSMQDCEPQQFCLME
jgi:dolichyl-phosphate-mannose--protein O-mannosyl transferase